MNPTDQPDVVETVAAVREHVAGARRAGKEIGFVPTLGALHDGHLSLIRAARDRCDYVVVSVFVNPTQFNDPRDLESYPRTLAEDVKACAALDVDLVFAPPVEQMYAANAVTMVRVSTITEPLCGRDRPGHFEGVTTVVAKLFNIVQPDVAFFGQKDAQQSLVVRRMVRDLHMPIEIVVCPTVREPDGLAMSSRNANLTPEQRQQALSLHASLEAALNAIAAGQRDPTALIRQMRDIINAAGPCTIDYVEIVHPETLEPIDTVASTMLIAMAVRIGQVRLIDNILVDPATPTR
jgi:pantoate--beta-alanine ligase